MRGLECAIDDLLPVGRIPPVVIGGNQLARAVIKLQARISQGAGNRKRWPDGAQDYSLRCGSGDDKTADERVIAGFHFQARGNITKRRLAVDDEDVVCSSSRRIPGRPRRPEGKSYCR